MKNRILALLVVVSLSANSLLAVAPTPTVPDSGATVGVLALGLLAVVALRRKLTK